MKYKLPDCRKCGACCCGGPNWIEVSIEDAKRINNPSLLEKGNFLTYSMKSRDDGACIALQGKLGYVRCSIYKKRPKACRKVRRSELCLYMLGWHGPHNPKLLLDTRPPICKHRK